MAVQQHRPSRRGATQRSAAGCGFLQMIQGKPSTRGQGIACKAGGGHGSESLVVVVVVVW